MAVLLKMICELDTLWWHAQDYVLPLGSPQRTFLEMILKSLGMLATKGPLFISRKLQKHRALPKCPSQKKDYEAWLLTYEPTLPILEIREQVQALTIKPLITLVVPLPKTHPAQLMEALGSVLAQAYPGWELCLLGDSAPELSPELSKDKRIQFIKTEHRFNLADRLNLALQKSQGEYVAVLEPEDRLSPLALLECVRALEQKPEAELVYADEDQLDSRGQRRKPFFKPDWSPELLLSMNYLTGLCLFRRSYLNQQGGFSTDAEMDPLYDMVLRLTSQQSTVCHVPKVLCHRRSRLAPWRGQKKAIEEALKKRAAVGEVHHKLHGTFRLKLELKSEPLVSIVIPTKDQCRLLKRCLKSIDEKTSYRKFEIILVDNGSQEPHALEILRQASQRHQVLQYDQPFNYSAINNVAAAKARGEYLLFLNNDVEVAHTDWLGSMLQVAQLPGVGVIGAKLLYPFNRIQCGPVVIGQGGEALQAFRYFPSKAPGYFGLANVLHNCSAVTGACLMIKTRLFKELGGFEEKMKVSFSDLDLCLKALDKGYRVVYNPAAVLYHHESATRGDLHPEEDKKVMQEKWAGFIAEGDPYYNPNLSLDYTDYRLKE